MVHIEKFTVKGHTYYKMVHNIRKDGKVKSKSRYIGKALPSKVKLERMKNEFYKEVQAARSASGPVKDANQDGFSITKSEFRSLIELLPEMIFRANPVTLVPNYVNSAVTSIFGYTPEDWLGDPHLWEKTIYVEDRQKVINSVYLAKKNKSAVDITYRILRKDDTQRWVTTRIDWDRDSEGNFVALLGVTQDITSGKASRDAFNLLFGGSPVPMLEHDYSRVLEYLKMYQLTSERKLKQYFANNPEEIRRVMSLVTVTNVNQATLNFFNAQDQESFLKVYYSRFFCRNSTEVWLQELVAIANFKSTFQSPMVVFDMSGRRLKVILHWSVPHAYANTYDKVLITLIDTSAQRMLAEIIRIKNFAMEISESGILVTDLEGNATYANKAFFDFWNIKDVESVMGENVSRYLPSEEKAAQIMGTLHSKGRWRGTVQIKRGDALYLETQGNLVRDEFNQPLGIVFTFFDVTEHLITEKIRLDFTNIAAHELKTPITPLKTFITMMLEQPAEYGLNERGKEFLQICVRNVNRLNVLIGDILDISRLEAKGMKFKMERFDLLDIVTKRMQDYVLQAKGKGLKLRSKLPKELPLIYGDPQRIGQVIGNLLKNAINFTDRGNILVDVRFMKSKVLVSVIDTGVGIGKADQEKLFTKFYQTDEISTRKVQGSGLGLAISKQIVLAHGGEMFVESEGKKLGSTFTFSLPLQKKKAVRKVDNPATVSGSTLDEELLLGEKPKIIKKKEELVK
jgi:PAS domain S-box-containing protein